MSVPLTFRPPLYPLPEYTVNTVASTHPHATYCREECWCGCSDYLEDTEAA